MAANIQFTEYACETVNNLMDDWHGWGILVRPVGGKKFVAKILGSVASEPPERFGVIRVIRLDEDGWQCVGEPFLLDLYGNRYPGDPPGLVYAKSITVL